VSAVGFATGMRTSDVTSATGTRSEVPPGHVARRAGARGVRACGDAGGGVARRLPRPTAAPASGGWCARRQRQHGSRASRVARDAPSAAPRACPRAAHRRDARVVPRRSRAGVRHRRLHCTHCGGRPRHRRWWLRRQRGGERCERHEAAQRRSTTPNDRAAEPDRHGSGGEGELRAAGPVTSDAQRPRRAPRYVSPGVRAMVMWRTSHIRAGRQAIE
jgi:hypothetical protein